MKIVLEREEYEKLDSAVTRLERQLIKFSVDFELPECENEVYEVISNNQVPSLTHTIFDMVEAVKQLREVLK
jgi:hypothetical protein